MNKSGSKPGTQKRRNAWTKWIAAAALVGGLAAGAMTMRAAAPQPGFSGDRAFELLKRQCDYGPRPPGTLAHEKTRAYLIDQMKSVTDKVFIQDFEAGKPKEYRMTNILGVINPDAPRKIMISAHWDTRPTADQEKILQNRFKPILGASDGASGAAVVLELARALKEKRPKDCILFMLFDGEDVGPDLSNMLLGARYFAKHMGTYRPNRVILLDMVGDADLNVYKEANSVNSDRELVDAIWKTAAEKGYGDKFIDQVGQNIQDDHIPLIDAGVKSIDIIDFDYPYWHTLEDTPDKCSPKSLEAVGVTLQAAIMKGL